MKDYIFEKEHKLKDYNPSHTGHLFEKDEAEEYLKRGVKKLANLQDKLYAFDKYSVLIILQASDASGKDGIIKHVMSGVNPQGCQVKSFKAPSNEELDHDYLWRCSKALPERGNIGIFNRSYYEEVLITKVHPEILNNQKLPKISDDIWKERYKDINNFEKYLTNNGTIILKFFLNISKEEQGERFLDRIEDPSKNWKFSEADFKERQYWDLYQKAYEDIFQNTSTDYAPWYVIPANKKWFSRIMICSIINQKLESLNLSYPNVSDEKKKSLELIKKELSKEFKK
jgi:PPK2 family polyphosphate:nucleotide phosphotransferase